MRDRDVVVVGGGPAGSAVATILARAGRDVLLLDAARFPRDKVCGEGVSPGAWPLLDRLEAAEDVRALAPRPLRGMRLVSPDGTAFEGSYRGEGRAGFAVRRLALDAALLSVARRAGAEVREGVPVRDVLLEGGTVAGVLAEEAGERRLVRAGVVVGADGRRSVVGRRLALLREHRSLRRFAVRGHWEGMQGLADYGEMHVAAGGYCGVAPLPGGAANVAFVLERRALAPAAGDLEGFYRGTLRRLWPRLAERLDGARLLEAPRAVGPLALECRSAAAPGAVLVGDAAGFYDPFTGEGVTLALRTAEMAAAAVLRALDSPGASVPLLAGYERARRAATRDKFRFNRLLQLAVSSRHAADAVARRLARRPDLADRLVGVAGDFEPARALVSPRVVWDLLTA